MMVLLGQRLGGPYCVSSMNTVPVSHPQTPYPIHHHGGEDLHPHTHGSIDVDIATSERGLWAMKVPLIGLIITTIASQQSHSSGNVLETWLL